MGYLKFNKKIQKIIVSEEKVSYYEDINEIEKKFWSLLTEAVKERSSELERLYLSVVMTKTQMAESLY